jgi:hypothetical protein
MHLKSALCKNAFEIESKTWKMFRGASAVNLLNFDLHFQAWLLASFINDKSSSFAMFILP